MDNKHKRQSKREARRQRRYDSMIKHCPTEALEKFREKPYQVESGGPYERKS